MALDLQSQVEIARMNNEAARANEAATRALAAWQVAALTTKQLEKDYAAAAKYAEECNKALIRALGGGG